MAFENIERPDDFLGVRPFTRSNGEARNPFDAAHGFGDSLWTREMGSYQSALDPSGRFGFNADARYNGALVAKRKIDAAVLGTTAHGNHSKSVDEIHWSSDPDNRPSFAQSILEEFNVKAERAANQLENNLISQAEYDRLTNEARIEGIKEHIAFTKTMEAGYLRQDSGGLHDATLQAHEVVRGTHFLSSVGAIKGRCYSNRILSKSDDRDRTACDWKLLRCPILKEHAGWLDRRPTGRSIQSFLKSGCKICA